MKQYLKNLLTAICGKNPYRQELDKLREEVEKAGENVSMLQDAYYGAQEKKVEADRVLANYVKQMNSYQTLVENYRDRLKEKEEEINKMLVDYQRQVENYEKRLGGYSVTIAELQKKNGELQDELDFLIGKENQQARGNEKKPKTEQKTEA